MPNIITAIGDTLADEDDVLAFSMLQTEDFALLFTFRDADQNPVDITGYTITGAIEFYTASVTQTGNVFDFADLVKHTRTTVALAPVIDSDPTTGRFSVRYTGSSLWPDPIDAAIVADVPVGASFFNINDGSNTHVERALTVFRRGITAPGS